MLKLRPSSTQQQLANPFPLDAEAQEICKLQDEQNRVQRFLQGFQEKMDKLVHATNIPSDERTNFLYKYSVQEKEAHTRERELSQLFWQKIIPYWKERTKKERKTLTHALNPLSVRNRFILQKAIHSRLKPKPNPTPAPLPTILEKNKLPANQYIEEIRQCFAQKNAANRRWQHIDMKTKQIKSQLAETSRSGPPSRLKALSMERGNARLQLHFAISKFWRKVITYWNDDLGDPDELIDALYPTDSPERAKFFDQLSEELAATSPPSHKTPLTNKDDSALALLALHSSG